MPRRVGWDRVRTHAARAANHAVAVVATAASMLGCSWGRFDDLSEQAPVVIFERPDWFAGTFGVQLATSSAEGRSRLFVLGSPGGGGGLTYDLGSSDQPTLDPVDSEICDPAEDQCALAQQAAALPHFSGFADQNRHCVAAGLRESLEGRGLRVRCDSDAGPANYILPIPSSVQTPDLEDQRGNLVLKATRQTEPIILAIWPQARSAFFYRSSRDAAVMLPLPEPLMGQLGPRAALLGLGDGSAIAALASQASEQVWLFRITADTTYSVGCLSGAAGFGRTLAAGGVNTNSVDDLLIADAASVTVFSGEALAALPESTSTACSAETLSPEARLAQFSCANTPDSQSCAASGFGDALAVGDIDGDSDGEVLVGAPRRSIRAQGNAGAVLVFDPDHASSPLINELFLSSAERDDNLGTVLVTPQIEGRQIVAASAPGGGKVALFYCNPLLPANARGQRCP